jgi:hypothetical protein
MRNHFNICILLISIFLVSICSAQQSHYTQPKAEISKNSTNAIGLYDTNNKRLIIPFCTSNKIFKVLPNTFINYDIERNFLQGVHLYKDTLVHTYPNHFVNVSRPSYYVFNIEYADTLPNFSINEFYSHGNRNDYLNSYFPVHQHHENYFSYAGASLEHGLLFVWQPMDNIELFDSTHLYKGKIEIYTTNKLKLIETFHYSGYYFNKDTLNIINYLMDTTINFSDSRIFPQYYVSPNIISKFLLVKNELRKISDKPISKTAITSLYDTFSSLNEPGLQIANYAQFQLNLNKKCPNCIHLNIDSTSFLHGSIDNLRLYTITDPIGTPVLHNYGIIHFPNLVSSSGNKTVVRNNNHIIINESIFATNDSGYRVVNKNPSSFIFDLKQNKKILHVTGEILVVHNRYFVKTAYPPDQLHLAKPTCIADFCGKITT